MTMTRSLAVAGCVLALLAGIVLADAKSDYEMLFGDEAKKVLATRSTADDAAFAKKLLDAAKALTDAPKTQVFIYEKVVQFGGKDAGGAPHALEAIGLLIKSQPAQKAKWEEAKLSVTEKQYQKSYGTARKEAAKVYLDVLIEAAEAKAAAGKAREAVELYRKGVPVAVYAAYQLSEIRDRMRGLVAGLEAQAEREKLTRKLTDDPKDTKVREKLILIYVLEVDDPAKAASLLATGVDQKLRENVSLAAKKPEDLTEAACMALGDWYHKTLLGKASAAGKAAVLTRAKTYYDRYLSLHTKRDMERYKASAALVEVNKELKKLASVAPSRSPHTGRLASRTVRIRFDSPRALQDFHTRDPSKWRVAGGVLLGQSESSKRKPVGLMLTYKTFFTKISRVMIRGGIVKPGKTDFRMSVGPINLIFNWSGGKENHYRNGEARTRQKGHVLTPGKLHAIVVEQVKDRVVVSVDGKPVYSATAVLQGTVTIYPADSTIAISQIEITGTPDPKREVQGHSHTNTY